MRWVSDAVRGHQQDRPVRTRGPMRSCPRCSTCSAHLEASDEQAGFSRPPSAYGERTGWASPSCTLGGRRRQDLRPLFETLIVEHVPAPVARPRRGPCRQCVCTLDWRRIPIVGRLLPGRIASVRGHASHDRQAPSPSWATAGKSRPGVRSAKLLSITRVSSRKTVDRGGARRGRCGRGHGRRFDGRRTPSATIPVETPEALPRIQVEEPTLEDDGSV